MTRDATFEDGAPRGLRLIAQTGEDVEVISSLMQDAVLPASEFEWSPSTRRFAMLINRFRWEENTTKPERVRAVLAIDDVTGISSQGVDRANRDVIYSVLALSWDPGQDGGGRLTLTLAGDGALRCDVEAINVTLQDMTQPYEAISGKTPQHPD